MIISPLGRYGCPSVAHLSKVTFTLRVRWMPLYNITLFFPKRTRLRSRFRLPPHTNAKGHRWDPISLGPNTPSLTPEGATETERASCQCLVPRTDNNPIYHNYPGSSSSPLNMYMPVPPVRTNSSGPLAQDFAYQHAYVCSNMLETFLHVTDG